MAILDLQIFGILLSIVAIAISVLSNYEDLLSLYIYTKMEPDVDVGITDKSIHIVEDDEVIQYSDIQEHDGIPMAGIGVRNDNDFDVKIEIDVEGPIYAELLSEYDGFSPESLPRESHKKFEGKKGKSFDDKQTIITFDSFILRSKCKKRSANVLFPVGDGSGAISKPDVTLTVKAYIAADLSEFEIAGWGILRNFGEVEFDPVIKNYHLTQSEAGQKETDESKAG